MVLTHALLSLDLISAARAELCSLKQQIQITALAAVALRSSAQKSHHRRGSRLTWESLLTLEAQLLAVLVLLVLLACSISFKPSQIWGQNPCCPPAPFCLLP